MSGYRPTGTATGKSPKPAKSRIPLDALKLAPKSKLFASITLVRDNEEIGRWPTDAPLMLYYAGAEIELDNWLI